MRPGLGCLSLMVAAVTFAGGASGAGGWSDSNNPGGAGVATAARDGAGFLGGPARIGELGGSGTGNDAASNRSPVVGAASSA